MLVRKKFFPLLFVLITGFLLLAANSYAQDVLADDESDSTAAPETPPLATKKTNDPSAQKNAWDAFVPPADDYDWIQLGSGEWLKGKLKVLYDHKLEFDSDELNLLKFDIEDVKKIRSSGIKGVRLEGPITVYGVLELTEDKVIIYSGGTKFEYDRSMLISIAHGADKESNYWTAKLSLGMNFTEGNTEQVDFTAILNVKRRTSARRLVFDYLGNFSKTRGVTTVDNNRLSGYMDIFKTRRYYLRPVFAEFYTDKFQNIDYRFTIGTGIGYHIINTSKTEWDITPGLAYQETRFVSVEPGEDIKVSTPSLVVGTKYDTEINSKIDFKASYSFSIVDETSGTYTHHLITTLETELTSWLDFDVSFVWDRIQEPTANADGTFPEPDDFQLIFGLGIDY